MAYWNINLSNDNESLSNNFFCSLNLIEEKLFFNVQDLDIFENDEVMILENGELIIHIEIKSSISEYKIDNSLYFLSFKILNYINKEVNLSKRFGTINLVFPNLKHVNRDTVDSFVGVSSEKDSRVYRVNYVTNRKFCYDSKMYINKRDNNLNYGYCNVLIPDSHKFGSTGSIWYKRWLKFSDDRLKILKKESLNKKLFYSEMKEKLLSSDTVIFIHGFNTSFEDSIIRSGQIGFDLEIENMITFSWPSNGEVSKYASDTSSIEFSIEYIKKFLVEISENSEDSEKIHIIAHSMGNRGLLRALQNMFLSKELKKFGQIFLAAPDVDSDVFKQLAYVYPAQSKRTTLYVSNKDKALKASQWLYDYPRVGLFPPVVTAKNIDTIEVSNIDLTDFLGHTYIANSSTLIYDIRDLITNNVEPKNRFKLESEKNYWKLKN